MNLLTAIQMRKICTCGFDTIAFTTGGLLREDYFRNRNWPLDFKFVGWEIITGRNGYTVRGWNVASKKLGVILRGHETQLHAVEICLPQLGWGHNCRLITNNDQLCSLFAHIQWLLSLLATPLDGSGIFIPGPWSPFVGHFTRIDIACDLLQQSGIWPLAINMEHPRIRSAQITHAGESVTLPGQKLQIRVYDKGKKSRLEESGRLMRLEIQFRDTLLEDYCGNHLRASAINTAWVPLVFARVLGELQEQSYRPVISRSAPRGLVSYLAEMEARAPLINPLEQYIYHMKRGGRTARELRKAVTRQIIQRQQHGFNDLLESAVDLSTIIPQGKLREIESTHRENIIQLYGEICERHLSVHGPML